MKALKTSLFYSVFATCLFATGCNTVQGVGEDIQSVGKKTAEVAAETKE